MGVFRGVYVVLITPFTSRGSVDLDGMARNVEWLIDQGVRGLVPLGSTGEFASLSDTEKKQITETVVSTAAGRAQVIVGASAETTEGAIKAVRQAKELGAAGAMVLPPWYYTPDPEEIVLHYRRISDAVPLPIVIYNNPFTSKVDIKPETIARIAALPNVDSVKECAGSIQRVAAIRELTNDRLGILCGWEDLAYESFLMGAVGWVSVCANIVPRLALDLFERAAEGDADEAWAIYRRLLPLLRYLEYEGKTQKLLKYALDKMGLCGGAYRSPKRPLNKAEVAAVEGILQPLGLY